MLEFSLWIVLLPCLAFQSSPELEGQRLIKQLRSDRIEDRNAAAQDLKKLGIPALPLLEAAIAEGDLDLASRARVIVNSIRAERVFRDIEAIVEKAKTLKVSITGSGTLRPVPGEKREQRLRGAVSTKEGNKAHLKFLLEWSDASVETEKISDGAKLKYSEGHGRTIDCPQVLGRNVKLALVRAGVLLGFVRGLGGSIRQIPVCEDPALTETLAVSDFLLDPEDRGEGCLSYTLVIAATEKVRVRLLYDVRTLIPRSRALEFTVEGNARKFTESYEEFRIDEPIPDHEFTVPKEN